MLKLYGSPTGPGSGEGPRGDNGEDKCGKTRHGSGACLHLVLFWGIGFGFLTRVALKTN